jgi:hypothetical protein
MAKVGLVGSDALRTSATSLHRLRLSSSVNIEPPAFLCGRGGKLACAPMPPQVDVPGQPPDLRNGAAAEKKGRERQTRADAHGHSVQLPLHEPVEGRSPRLHVHLLAAFVGGQAAVRHKPHFTTPRAAIVLPLGQNTLVRVGGLVLAASIESTTWRYLTLAQTRQTGIASRLVPSWTSRLSPQLAAGTSPAPLRRPRILRGSSSWCGR